MNEHYATTPANAELAAPLIFRSRSGRTEVTWLSDGSLDLRVRTGQDVLDQADRDRLIAAIARKREGGASGD